jgi:hypothetical protein
MTLKIRLFKNNYKEPGDNKPAFQNSSISYPDYVFKKGTKHKIGLWKNDDGSLSIQISERTDVTSAPPQSSQDTEKSFNIDPSKIMGRPEYQAAQMKKSRLEKANTENNQEEDIPF